VGTSSRAETCELLLTFWCTCIKVTLSPLIQSPV
jgi:hypothetical protein